MTAKKLKQFAIDGTGKKKKLIQEDKLSPLTKKHDMVHEEEVTTNSENNSIFVSITFFCLFAHSLKFRICL